MANLPDLLRCYISFQKLRYNPEITKLTTSEGRVTVTLRKFMSHEDVVDETLLGDYDVFIRRDPLATRFRSLLDVGWDRNSSKASRKFSFNLTAAAASIRELQFYDQIQQTPAVKLPLAVTPDHENESETSLPTETPSLKRSRTSQKISYSPATLAKYSKIIETKLILLLKNEIPSANNELQNQVLKDVMTRLEKRFGDRICDVNEVIVSNMKALIKSLNKFGVHDRETIRFKENIALAVSGDTSFQKLMDATGLSRRVLEHGREMRTAFDCETAKAIAEIPADEVVNDNAYEDCNDDDDDDDSEADTVNDSDDDGNDSDDNDNDINKDNDQNDTALFNGVPSKRKRVVNGQKVTNKNRYRRCISSRSRKIRIDTITGEEIQRFCHESQWGGRIDTLKLSKQSIIVDQPGGGCEYEPIRSYQYTVSEMYSYFKESEYGTRQRNNNGGRNLSLRRFRELICPCMTKAKQRDTADQIVAEFKQCLKSWNLMRKNDRNVRASILRCASTLCPLHAEGSSKAALYSAASKTTTTFLEYILCPKIYRDELAVHVRDSNTENESFSSKREKQIRINIAAAEARKEMESANFNASCSRKGIQINTLHCTNYRLQ